MMRSENAHGRGRDHFGSVADSFRLSRVWLC